MSSELPPNQNDRHELEARLTALILGELSADQAAALQSAMARDHELAQLYERLKTTVQLVRETAATATSAPESVPLKLSADRREKLLAQFKTVAPKEFAKPQSRKRVFRMTIVELAAVLAILATLAGMLLPVFLAAKSRSRRVVVINNLRQLDGAKKQWALENKAGPDARPTFKDIQPYLGRGSGELPKPVQGEIYVLGKVSEAPVAELKRGIQITHLSLGDENSQPAPMNGVVTFSSPLARPAAKASENGRQYSVANAELADLDQAKKSLEARRNAENQAPTETPREIDHYQIALPQAESPSTAAAKSLPPGDRGWGDRPAEPALTSNAMKPGGHGQGGSAFESGGTDVDSFVAPRTGTPELALNFQTSPMAPVPATPPASGRIVLPSPDQADKDAGKSTLQSANGVGDPEWIGILNQPAPSTSTSNPFIGRYALRVVTNGADVNLGSVDATTGLPVAQLSDLNSIQNNGGPAGGDEYMRRRYGVATEITSEPSQNNQTTQGPGWTDKLHTKNGGTDLGITQPLTPERL
ncbi:MAG TPA: hypothetical protein VN281_18715, partial [Verrucomicrobiae bacterium]|nr:hypothetical protein [Verrucomicrobiae bacterium]